MLRDNRTENEGQPDWAALVARWGGVALLHTDVSMVTLALRAVGKVAYLATPYHDYCDGTALAADLADEWRRSLIGLAKLRCYSPAVNAQIVTDFTGDEAPVNRPHVTSELRLVELVVVPPMAGWEASPEVWRVVRTALALNLPVYVLAEQAGRL
ncbi:hypothetical protein DL239_20260 [Sedimentitalea sp. CY04]|uniref:Uncharacterized protein n=1 Tax=Parasedimentitalea denitrificans TaxID=2211118 RepID=A0ABX0WEX9_9RHOB|nr:hypothetical protein [Sedimentitalea sp. CY04]NIZ63305.1 hypothetical protein [Sedimentitalea sp. CY04]